MICPNCVFSLGENINTIKDNYILFMKMAYIYEDSKSYKLLNNTILSPYGKKMIKRTAFIMFLVRTPLNALY